MVKEQLQRQWLHIHVIDGDVYVFLDDGHWENSHCKDSRQDWLDSSEHTVESLDHECCIGSIDYNNFRARILLNPKILLGKFGMPYVEKA